MFFCSFCDTIDARRRCTASNRRIAADAASISSRTVNVYIVFFSVFMACLLFCLCEFVVLYVAKLSILRESL